MVEVRGLRKCYGSTVALDALSFGVPRGAIVGLLGPNGAGKSSCLRIISGYTKPTSGEVLVAGLDVHRTGLRGRRQLGYLPEAVPMYPELRAREYLSFRARLKRVPRLQRRRELERVEALCGLGDVRRRIVGQLSRGYRQRLGLADALLGSPPLLVLDEPTAGLDPNQIRQVRQLLRSLAGEQTILLSTHILPEVEAVCDGVLILDQGRLVGQGAADAICRQQHAERVRVEVRGTIDEVRRALSELEGVEGVEVDPVRGESEVAGYRLAGALDAAALEGLSALLASRGFALRELRRERGLLEDVFARLTQREQPRADRPEPDGSGGREA